MKISFPQNYNFRDIAIVEDGILCIKEICSFKALMYDLTAFVRDINRCYFCSKPIYKSSAETLKNNNFRTFDHLYPQDLGGPTLPYNLVPSCPSCNCKKANMTERDFKVYKRLSESKQKVFMAEAYKNYKFLKRWHTPLVPIDYYFYTTPNQIVVPSKQIREKELKKIKDMFFEYGRIYRPIIVDRNNVLLDGYGVMNFIQQYPGKVTYVPVIRLDNVVLQVCTNKKTK